MLDRVPKYPGRVRLTPVPGEENTFDMTRADEATQDGDALNKATLLKDETAALFGFDANAVPDDAFRHIANQLRLIASGSAMINLTVLDGAGIPVKNVLVSGVYDSAGTAAYTNNEGKVSGLIAADGTTLSISGYLDVTNYSETVTVGKGETLTKTITVARKSNVTVSSSSNVQFSGNVSEFDICLCGAGAGGCMYDPDRGSPGVGGGGGYVVNVYDVPYIEDSVYRVTIGSGGAGGIGGSSYGKAGGTTSLIKDGTVIHSAAGGLGGGNAGNGNGGTKTTAATNGTIRVFDDPSGLLPGGGGASSYGSPGQGFGGAANTSGSAPGGGGGGGYSEKYYQGGTGGAGRVYLRWEVA